MGHRHRPGLLVSVRDAHEARAARAAGAALIDVKEPARGPLGRADVSTWHDVRAVIPDDVPVSVALGDLPDWADDGTSGSRLAWPTGLSFVKLGLAGAGRGVDWLQRWRRVRSALGSPAPWVAVAYADADRADAPSPDQVLDAAISDGCAGVLLDTFDKTRRGPIDGRWSGWIERARSSGLRIAVAGSLDVGSIRDLRGRLAPDWFAVRGAACVGGDRNAAVDPDRVAMLVAALDQA
jgi:uncharacterized protein (UPF0264 family)